MTIQVTTLDGALKVTPAVTSGSWTPVIGGSGGESGQSYTSQAGTWVKIQHQGFSIITVTGEAVLSAKGTITGAVQIKGLPFAAANVANQNQICPMSWASLATNWTYLQGVIGPAAQTVTIAGTTAAATGVGTLTTTDIANTSVLAFNATYIGD